MRRGQTRDKFDKIITTKNVGNRSLKSVRFSGGDSNFLGEVGSSVKGGHDIGFVVDNSTVRSAMRLSQRLEYESKIRQTQHLISGNQQDANVAAQLLLQAQCIRDNINRWI